MTIQMTCPGCGKTLQAPDGFAGKRAKCKSCGTATIISGGDNTAIEDLVQVVEAEEVVAVPASRVDDDEEERRPRRRDRSREDDEHEEDEAPRRERPRRRRKRRQSSGGSGAKVAVIAGSIALVFLILLGAGGYAGWYYLYKDHGPLSAERKYLPDSLSSLSIYQFDLAKSRPGFDAIRKCSNYKSQFSFAVTSGGKDLDIVRAVVVSRPFDLAILTMRNPVTIKDIVDDGAEATETTANGKTIYVVGKKGYFIDGKRVLVASPDWVRHILDLPSEMTIPDKMQKAMAQADFSKPEVHFETFDDANRQNGSGFVNPMAEPPVAMVAEVDYQSPVGFLLKFMCQDAATANKMADFFRTPIVQKAFGPLRGAAIEVADATVTLRASVNTSDVCSIVK